MGSQTVRNDWATELNWTGKEMHLGDLPGSPWQLRLPDRLHRVWVWSLVLVVVQLFSPVNSWWPHGLQHTRLPGPTLSPGVCSKSCPLSWWCHPAISSSVALFSCHQTFPASGCFPVSWLFASDGQVGSLHQKQVLELQHQLFRWIFSTDFF